jgi:hypothetical protein
MLIDPALATPAAPMISNTTTHVFHFTLIFLVSFFFFRQVSPRASHVGAMVTLPLRPPTFAGKAHLLLTKQLIQQPCHSGFIFLAA